MKTLKTSFSEIITEYHRLFAITKKKEYLDAAAEIAKIPTTDFEEIWQKKVNEGCDKQEMPRIYPKTGDNSPLPTTKDVE